MKRFARNPLTWLILLLLALPCARGASAQEADSIYVARTDSVVMYIVPRGLLEDYVHIATVVIPTAMRTIESLDEVASADSAALSNAKTRIDALERQSSDLRQAVALMEDAQRERKAMIGTLTAAVKQEKRRRRYAMVGAGVVVVAAVLF